jgi:aldehyde:ferredoxin oxidoreductase
MRFGRRTVTLLRCFNLRCGITPDLERPSKRYGSIPVDGPAQGQDIMAHWEDMLNTWYEHSGYHRDSGKPLPETLRELELEWLIPELWPELAARVENRNA